MDWVVVFLVIVAIVSTVKYFIKQTEKEQRRQKDAAVQQEEDLAHLQLLQKYRQRMIDLGNESIDVFKSLPEHLQSAEACLDKAESDFSDGAFAPFWDSIEKATTKLGHFVEDIHKIKGKASEHAGLAEEYELEPPKFPIARQAVDKLTVGTATAERMKNIVRTAQCNFQFATIYEQRKTNQILVAGFTSLAQALNQMTWEIKASIDNLSSLVASIGYAQIESMRAIHSRLGDIAESNERYHEEVMKKATKNSEKQIEALEMLDNIQRHRRPGFL